MVDAVDLERTVAAMGCVDGIALGDLESCSGRAASRSGNACTVWIAVLAVAAGLQGRRELAQGLALGRGLPAGAHRIVSRAPPYATSAMPTIKLSDAVRAGQCRISQAVTRVRRRCAVGSAHAVTAAIAISGRT